MNQKKINKSIFSSETKNQHYVSQVEQRANASNKNASNKKMNIYKYTKIDENQFNSGVSIKIETNQSDNDLYTFAIKGNLRKNLENLMTDFESDYSAVVNNIEKSCELHKNGESVIVSEMDDIKKILQLKFLNKFRNPYTIKNTINIFPFKSDIILDDDRHLEALIALRKADNHINFLCKKYSVSKEEYIAWINTLVGLLLPNPKDGISLLAGMADEYFRADELGKIIKVYYYDINSVLLPECGMIEIPTENMISFAVNITSNIFIIIAMPVIKNVAHLTVKKRSKQDMDALIKQINEIVEEKLRQQNPEIKSFHISDELKKNALECYLKTETEYYTQPSIKYYRNDIEMLNTFNAGVKRFATQYYFSSNQS